MLWFNVLEFDCYGMLSTCCLEQNNVIDNAIKINWINADIRQSKPIIPERSSRNLRKALPQPYEKLDFFN